MLTFYGSKDFMKKENRNKKQTIIQAATEIFQELDLNELLCQKILPKVGGSKATIYNYFTSNRRPIFEIVTLSNEKNSICT